MAIKKSITHILCGASLALAAFTAAGADAYPSKSIKIIVYVGPGTLVDVTTRVVAEKLSEKLGQPVVVENMPGAAGLLGIRYVKNAPADGYTLLAGTNTVAQAPVLTNSPGYELKDFTAVGGMNRAPFVMVGPIDQPSKDLASLMATAKAKPGALTFASGGVGTTTFMVGSIFLHSAGIKMLHVPYKGTGAAMPDVIGGRVNMMFDAESSAAPHVRDGRLRAFGVTSSVRTKSLPDVPTLAEQGLTDFSFSIYNTILVRTGTPKDVVQRLSDALDSVIKSDAIQERFRRDGSEPFVIAPAELNELMRKDQMRIQKVATDMGMEKQ
jgi:tripartite-type tricarboxylate transporter receptor subunit TctC